MRNLRFAVYESLFSHCGFSQKSGLPGLLEEKIHEGVVVQVFWEMSFV